MQKKGISLIVLVITIIVMIILAAAVVISMSNNGIIDKASHAVQLTDEKQVQDLAALAWAEAYLDETRTDTMEKAVKDALEKNGVTDTDWNITVTDTGVAVSKKDSNSNTNVEITDLTNTTWKITDATCTAGYGRYTLNFYVDYYQGTHMSNALFIGYTGSFGDGIEDSFTTPTANKVREFSGAYDIQVGDVIEIVGGEDVADSTLIEWLKTHATKQ